MRAVVTGAAGFIGSHLSERLLADGHEVIGIDCLTDYYAVRLKQDNLGAVGGRGRTARGAFTFYQEDLVAAPLARRCAGADVIFHLAGQPGVRDSWHEGFSAYVERNVRATHALLEAVVELRDAGCGPSTVVFGSSSSVYGDAETYPTDELVLPRPVAPYGVTKLAAEQLCEAYRRTYGLPIASLRFFTVYGPRQRPDMAFSRLVTAALRGSPFCLYGDGDQTRDFTYVGDIVDGLIAAARCGWTGVANLGRGQRCSINEVVETVAQLAGPVALVHRPAAAGDVRHTGADITRAAKGFDFAPKVSLRDGLAQMIADARRRAPWAWDKTAAA